MTRSRLDHLRSEDGIAIVVAMILMTLMLSFGVAAIALTDAQTKLTGNQRQRETSFNIAEAALNAQVTQLSDHWIAQNGSGVGAVPSFTPCPGGNYCPDGTELTSLVPSGDTRQSATNTVQWTTKVFDNTGGLETYYNDALATTQCGCDANGDGKVWVRAQATVRGRTRTIVSLIQQQMQAESAPHAAIIAGALSISNNGAKELIDAGAGVLAVRCSVPDDGTKEDPQSPCLGQPLGQGSTKDTSSWNQLLSQQISGFAGAQQDYPAQSVFTQDQINRFIDTAKAQKTYYTGCPSTLTGKLVVIDTIGDCSYQGNGTDTYNTEEDPGFLIMLRSGSSLSLSGSRTYFGIVYHANMGAPPALNSAPQSSGTLISVQGNARIRGGVIIDGPGRIQVGSSGNNPQVNVEFDDHGYDAVQSFAGAGIIQNSWREIKAAS